jgi:hypothetical protein
MITITTITGTKIPTLSFFLGCLFLAPFFSSLRSFFLEGFLGFSSLREIRMGFEKMLLQVLFFHFYPAKGAVLALFCHTNTFLSGIL